MDSELFGIVNGHIVDEHLLRGGNVSAQGVATLVQLHVATVISLKNDKDDSAADNAAEYQQCLDAGLQWQGFPMDHSGIFSYDDSAKAPSILEAIAAVNGKVLVHCAHGSDRTGLVVACYRIQHGWTAKAALAEMKHYGNSWIHFAMRRYVESYGR
jgi:protein-tyrosine phosphatase